jgi:hypothetical protein
MSISHSQAFGNQNPAIPQGVNGSEALAIQQNEQIVIGLPKTKKMLKFKSFITNFSRTTESAYEEGAFAVATSPRVIKGAITNKIILSFDLPSQSINEGRVNLNKVQELCRVFMSSSEDLRKFTHNPTFYTVFVLFSNLICGDLYLGQQINTFGELIQNGGLECVFTGFSFDIDVEAGFYEGASSNDNRDVGKLIPKKMNLTLELTPFTESRRAQVNTSAVEGFIESEGLSDAQAARVNEFLPLDFIEANSTIERRKIKRFTKLQGQEESWPFGIDYPNLADE